MTQVLASSKLDKFDLKGELDELAPLIKNGLYKKFNFEGALDTYINLRESNILIIQKYSSGNMKPLLQPKCDNITFKDIQNDANFFTNMTLDYAKAYDLIVLDAHVWAVSGQDIEKSKDLTNNGIPCLLVGNDTTGNGYGTNYESVTITPSSEISTSQINKDMIPFALDNYTFRNLDDGAQYARGLYSDKSFPILICKDYYPMIAYQADCNTVSILDNTTGFVNNQSFLFKIVEWLISTKRMVDFSKDILFNDGIVCQEAYKNLWTRYSTSSGEFGGSARSGDWSFPVDFRGELPEECGDNPRIIQCSPKQGMNYFTIFSQDNANYPDSSYPTGSKYWLSCWAYVEENCDMQQRYVRILGESRTPGGSEGYDFTRKGTWQHLTSFITSTNAGFYFLLYCNVGYPSATDNLWTKGNVYFTNITICKVNNNEKFRYIDCETPYNDKLITIDNLNIKSDFTIIYDYEQIVNYVDNLNQFQNKRIIAFYNADNKPLIISDYFIASGKSAAWLANDSFVNNTVGWWHNHISERTSRYPGDRAFIVLRKMGNKIQWFIVYKDNLNGAGEQDVSAFPELLNFTPKRIVISNEHGGLAKNLLIYNRALSFDEITALGRTKKHMQITTDGNLNTEKYIEKEWLPDNCFYSPLSKDSYNNITSSNNLVYEDDWAFTGNVRNFLGKNCLNNNGSDLVTCIYNENENEYTVYIPKNDALLWYQKGVKVNYVPVDGNERYVFSAEIYCDKDIKIGIDLNNNATGIASNDNHTVIQNTFNRLKGGKYNKLYCIYDLFDNAPIFSCSNAIYINQEQEIPPEGITIKIKNPILNKIVGGKANNIINRYYPWTDGESYSAYLKFNLYNSLGFKWNEPWTICYMKKPIAGNTSASYATERQGYVIDSIGCNNNSAGGGYLWFGKALNDNRITISSGTLTSFIPDEFYYKQQMCVLRYENGRMTLNVYLENGKRLDSVLDYNISTPNKFVTQFDSDLVLGGWDTVKCQAFYKDLIVAQRVLTEEELTRIFKARIIDEPNKTNIGGLLQEGGI